MAKEKRNWAIGMIAGVLIIALIAFVGINFAKNMKIRNTLQIASQYIEEMQYEEAVATFKTVIEIDSQNAEALEGIEQVCNIQIEKLLEDKEYEQALVALESYKEWIDETKLAEQVDKINFLKVVQEREKQEKIEQEKEDQEERKSGEQKDIEKVETETEETKQEKTEGEIADNLVEEEAEGEREEIKRSPEEIGEEQLTNSAIAITPEQQWIDSVYAGLQSGNTEILLSLLGDVEKVKSVCNPYPYEELENDELHKNYLLKTSDGKTFAIKVYADNEVCAIISSADNLEHGLGYLSEADRYADIINGTLQEWSDGSGSNENTTIAWYP